MPGYTDLEHSPWTDDDYEATRQEYSREASDYYGTLLSKVKAELELLADPDNGPDYPPTIIELVSIDDPYHITCLTSDNNLTRFYYEPYDYPGTLYEPPEHGVNFDWEELT